MKVGILGAGKSGLAAARLLLKKGDAVFLSEKGALPSGLPKKIEAESGGHSGRLLECELIVRSPGVPNHLPILLQAKKKRIPIWGELELASRFTRSKRIIAITGTNGKTTTTTLVGELFKSDKQKTLVGGNIGTPLADLVSRASASSTLVLETSSYQLEDIHQFHPTISAILNITPDHLEHHGTMRAYAAAKARVFTNQTSKDICVLNADDATCRRLARSCKARLFWFSRTKDLPQGILYKEGEVILRWGKVRARFPLKTRLPGPHNVENVLAAIAIAVAGGVSIPVIQKALKRFPGVAHRLEWVRSLNGVDYINDSKGTNVDSTRVALASFEKPILLIAGGQGKKAPYTPLRELVKARVRHILLIGEDAPQIRRELGNLVPCQDCGTMAQAVKQAKKLARAGDVVLLSPACASFDQYRNYEHRGEDFKCLVQALR